MRRFGYENPYQKSRFPRPRFGCFLVLFIGFLALAWRVDQPWNPLRGSKIRSYWSPTSTPTAPKTVRPSLVPHLDNPNPSLQATSRPSLVPHLGTGLQAEPTQQRPTATPPSNAPKFSYTESNLPLKLPGRPQVFEKRNAKLAQLEAKIARFPAFEFYRELSEEHLRLGNNDAAARIMHTEARIYRAKGLQDAATILDARAARNETTIRAFVPTPTKKAARLARLEPQSGTYLGAFIDRDDALNERFEGDNWQYHRFPHEFEAVTKRRHATYFTYVSYGNFPRQWLEMCKSEGVIPQIAWEPQDLNQVQNNEYLRSCALFLRDLELARFRALCRRNERRLDALSRQPKTLSPEIPPRSSGAA